MGRLIKYVIVLILIVLIAVAAVPLNSYHRYVSSWLEPIKLEGISGSAVKGNAEKVYYSGLELGQVSWFLHPVSWKAIGGTFQTRGEFYDLRFKAGKQADSSIDLNQLRGIIDLKAIEPFVHIQKQQIQGEIHLDIPQLKYDVVNGIDNATGEVVLKELKMMQGRGKNLGEIRMQLETKTQGKIVGQITSDSAVMQVSGTLFVQPHRWQLNLDIMPNPGEFELQSIISQIGFARAGGGRKLQLAGFY